MGVSDIKQLFTKNNIVINNTGKNTLIFSKTCVFTSEYHETAFDKLDALHKTCEENQVSIESFIDDATIMVKTYIDNNINYPCRENLIISNIDTEYDPQWNMLIISIDCISKKYDYNNLKTLTVVDIESITSHMNHIMNYVFNKIIEFSTMLTCH